MNEFIIKNGEIPVVIINDIKLALVKVKYYWTTATESTPCKTHAIVSGYLNDEKEIRVFRFNFISKEVEELFNNGGN